MEELITQNGIVNILTLTTNFLTFFLFSVYTIINLYVILIFIGLKIVMIPCYLNVSYFVGNVCKVYRDPSYNK